MDVFDRIKRVVNEHDVVLFMKGLPDSPYCGFSAQVATILTRGVVDFHSVDVLADEEIRQGIKDFSEWPTIPQLYVKGEFVGGCDIISEMYSTGELGQLFEENNITNHL
jgi:monothiol glutaredoxin